MWSNLIKSTCQNQVMIYPDTEFESYCGLEAGFSSQEILLNIAFDLICARLEFQAGEWDGNEGSSPENSGCAERKRWSGCKIDKEGSGMWSEVWRKGLLWEHRIKNL